MMHTAATKGAQTPLAIDVIVEADAWNHHDAENIVRRAIEAATAFESTNGEIAVMLTDDETIRQLNAQWRGMDKPTNVLSFPASDIAAVQEGHLGDIAIAYETVSREAEADDKAFTDHLAHLAIHGYLHLIGFDHETDDDALHMEGLETRILASLAIADPYADRKLAD